MQKQTIKNLLRIGISISKDCYDLLRKKADAENKSLSGTLTAILKEYFKIGTK